MTACARCGTNAQLDDASGWCQTCLNGPIGRLTQRTSAVFGIPLEDLTRNLRFRIPESGTEQENHMQRVLRWDVPVDDQWHDIGGGPVVHVAARAHRERPGDLVEVWTLEDNAPDAQIPKRSVTIVGTGHNVPDGVYHLGSAVVPTLTVVQSMLRGGKEHIESRAGLVWHLFAKHDEAERVALAEEGRRLASIREDLMAQGVDPSELLTPEYPDGVPPVQMLGAALAHQRARTRQAKVETLDDEATSLTYWLAEKLGEHVDDQDGETLIETVRRLMGDGVAAHRRATGGGPHIGGFQRGHTVTIGSNGDKFEGQTGVVATLDHDHGWRLWVRVGTDMHDQHAPALYLSPDDIDPQP